MNPFKRNEANAYFTSLNCLTLLSHLSMLTELKTNTSSLTPFLHHLHFP